MASFHVCIFLASLTSFIGFRPTQQQVTLSQYQQYQQNFVNRMNGRGLQTTAFMMNRGRPHTNASLSQYITFTNTAIVNNARVFREYGAFETSVPGLYSFSFQIRGANASQSTEVRMMIRPGSTGVSTPYASILAEGTQQVSASSLAVLAFNDTVFLQRITGTVFDDSVNNTYFNSFSGILLVAEYNNNPFVQNVFPNNVPSPNSVSSSNNVLSGRSAGSNSFPNPMSSYFGIPFLT